MITDEEHAAFEGRLKGSVPAVELVAEWLRRKGMPCTVAPLRIAPSPAEYKAYKDGGDIVLDDTGGIVEVKGISRSFTGHHDWPFNDEVFVDGAGSGDRERVGRLVAYVTVGANRTTGAIILADTRPHWYVTSRFNSVTGKVEAYYAVEKKHVVWRRLV
jgi:hypothetical protein